MPWEKQHPSAIDVIDRRTLRVGGHSLHIEIDLLSPGLFRATLGGDEDCSELCRTPDLAGILRQIQVLEQAGFNDQRKEIMAFCKLNRAMEDDVQFVIFMEGGIVSSIVTDCESLVGRGIAIVDYDTEGVDDSQCFSVDQGGHTEQATGRIETVEFGAISSILASINETEPALREYVAASGTKPNA